MCACVCVSGCHLFSSHHTYTQPPPLFRQDFGAARQHQHHQGVEESGARKGGCLKSVVRCQQGHKQQVQHCKGRRQRLLWPLGSLHRRSHVTAGHLQLPGQGDGSQASATAQAKELHWQLKQHRTFASFVCLCFIACTACLASALFKRVVLAFIVLA